VPEIHGHRGARALRPENTLPGLEYALALGVDALEFDVTLTADGGLILAHDLIVEARTILDTGPATDADPLFPYVGKRWSELTLKQVATLDAGGRRPPEPFQDTFQAIPGTAVPTLGQVCARLAGAREVTLAVELKTDPSWPDAAVRRLTQTALATLARHRLAGRARILGFDWRVLRAAAAAEPAVPRVALLEQGSWNDPVRAAAEARDIGAAWLSPSVPVASPGLIAAAREMGLKTAVWTVNDPAQMTEFADRGVDAIVTDRPDLLRQVLDDRSG